MTVRLNRNFVIGAVLLVGSFGLLVWLDAAYIMPIKSLNIPNLDNDLGVFWTGARTVWQGGNPYNFAPGSLFHQIAAQAGGDSDIFLSPFYLSLFFLPLAILPLNLAGLVWLVFIQLLLGLSVALIIRLSGQQVTPGPLAGLPGSGNFMAIHLRGDDPQQPEPGDAVRGRRLLLLQSDRSPHAGRYPGGSLAGQAATGLPDLAPAAGRPYRRNRPRYRPETEWLA